MDKPTISPAQIKSLARPIVAMAEKILSYYNDPQHEQAFQDWYLKKYGHRPPEGV